MADKPTITIRKTLTYTFECDSAPTVEQCEEFEALLTDNYEIQSLDSIMDTAYHDLSERLKITMLEADLSWDVEID